MLAQLDALYQVLRLDWNSFQPLRTLTAKVRRGARVIKRYHPAQTPYQRLLASGVLSGAQQQALAATSRALNPVALRAQIHEALHRVGQLADRPRGESDERGRRALAR